MGFIPHLGFIYPTELRFVALALWDIITSVWDKSPYPMAGCWISYNIKIVLQEYVIIAVAGQGNEDRDQRYTCIYENENESVSHSF